jgi:hypothetical protein
MRLAAFTLAMLGLLFVSTIVAIAQEQPANAPTTPQASTATDEAVVAPIRWYAYRPIPGWYGYYRSPPYYTYRPRVYWYGPPRYYATMWRRIRVITTRTDLVSSITGREGRSVLASDVWAETRMNGRRVGHEDRGRHRTRPFRIFQPCV